MGDARAYSDKLGRRLRALAEEAAGSPYWVYVVRDPLTGDRRDWTTGDPIRVGQTSDPVRRLEQFVTAAGQAAGKAASEFNQRLHHMLSVGRVPVFELVEGAPTRLAALAGEACWARRLESEGFELLGPRIEHGGGEEAGFGSTGVPVELAWTLTLDEARADGVGLAIACEACGLEQGMDVGDVIARSRADLPLTQLRDGFSCPNCGRLPCLELLPPTTPAAAEAQA